MTHPLDDILPELIGSDRPEQAVLGRLLATGIHHTVEKWIDSETASGKHWGDAQIAFTKFVSIGYFLFSQQVKPGAEKDWEGAVLAAFKEMLDSLVEGQVGFRASVKKRVEAVIGGKND